MSYIEDTRKLMQDFLAPELRAISVRLDALEETVDANERRAQQRFSELSQQTQDVETRTQQRFSEVERRAEQRHSETLNAISNLSSYQAVLERLARLESKQNVSAA